MKKYRDGLFRDYFSDKRRLLSLCNALTGEDSADPNELVVNTLDGVFFDELKNDLSCIYRGKFLVIIEHQSTINENMPLRIFLYAAELFKQHVESFKGQIYLGGRVILPTPEFFVFYNGDRKEFEQREMRLSDSFLDNRNFLEVVVKVYNINEGMNGDLISKSEPLNNYCTFVNCVKQNLKMGLSLEYAIAETFKFCQENNIMAEYLDGRRKELVSMLGLEYDPEEARKAFINYGIQQGIGIGREQGIEIGKEEKTIDFVSKMLQENISIETISKISGWSEEEILKIFKD